LNPLGPSPASDGRTTLPATSMTITVTDGWTGAAVPGATVTAGGSEVLTDANGTFVLTAAPVKCLPLDIVATGFLSRRVCAKPSVTLWPIADEAEEAATRAAAFPHFDRLLDQADYARVYGVVLQPDILQYPGVEATWVEAAAEIKEATGGKLAIQFLPSLKWDEGYLVSAASEPGLCSLTWSKWTISVAGFCWMPTATYFVSNAAIDPHAIARRDVALRVLLDAYSLRPHSLPGLMNETRPATELSEFERKTLHMMSLRWGTEVRWPDFDKLP